MYAIQYEIGKKYLKMYVDLRYADVSLVFKWKEGTPNIPCKCENKHLCLTSTVSILGPMLIKHLLLLPGEYYKHLKQCFPTFLSRDPLFLIFK